MHKGRMKIFESSGVGSALGLQFERGKDNLWQCVFMLVLQWHILIFNLLIF